MKRPFALLLLVLASLAAGGCAEVIIGPLIGGPLGSAVEKAVREPTAGETPSTENR